MTRFTQLFTLGLCMSLVPACSKRNDGEEDETSIDKDSAGSTKEQGNSSSKDQPSNDDSDDKTSGNAGDTETATADPPNTEVNGSNTPSSQDSSGSESSTGGSTDTTSGTESSSQSTGQTTSSSTDTNQTPGTIACGSKVWSCGDGIDNDNDGKIDLDDPECTSPCDDTEDTFATNLPGQNNDCKADCYFDANSGGGEDGCEFNLKCDAEGAGGTRCPHDPGLTQCDPAQKQSCLDFCTPLIPNGCDCFGCCGVETSMGTRYISLSSGSACSMSNLDECSSCTFNEQCSNKCERDKCELCFGDEALADGCSESTCDNGVTACTTTADCAADSFCLTGCCVLIPG